LNTILVTGATGCVGSNLIAALLERGSGVRAFRRANSDLRALRGLDVEHFIGDVRDQDSLRRAMRGCDTVFHTAALVSFWKKRYEEQFAINVHGTRNVVNACIDLGIETLIHTSSVAALGFRNDEKLIDESIAYNWHMRTGYRYSKHCAELEVMNGVAHGLHAVMVNPTVIIGARDTYIHGGQIIRDVKRGRIPVYLAGGMNVVGVHDVVRGHIAASERGGSGERYILAGTNMTHREVFTLAARIVGGRAPKIRVPVSTAKFIAKLFDMAGTITGTQPWVTTDLLSSTGIFNWYTYAKAERELGYHPASIEESMREAYEWYVKEKMI